MDSKDNRTVRGLTVAVLIALLIFSVLAITAFARAGHGSQVAEGVAIQTRDLSVDKGMSLSEVGQIPTVTEETGIEPDALALVAAYEQVLNGIYERVLPSVVHIEVAQRSNGLAAIPGLPFDHPDLPEGLQRGEGSGFIWDKEGHIVTNYHVVEDAEEVKVVFSDGSQADGQVLGSDANVDLAVVAVDVPADDLVPVQLGDSSSLLVGQLAVAIGNPFGLENTMTFGIVSALGRTIASGTSQFSIPEVIQTDAPINPGNSGGPLLDREGRVIGINTQIVTRSGSNSGIGFAVPADIARRVVPVLIEQGSFEYAWLGISGQTLTAELAELMQIPGETKGAVIISVADNGPAEMAGLRGSEQTGQIDGVDVPVGGDIIVSINGQPVEGMDDLIRYLTEEASPGELVKLKVLRGQGRTVTVDVTLGTRPASLE